MTPATAAPPGNNGTVKVDELDLAGGPGGPPGADNDPHIADCVGQIEWYGFDEGAQAATATFEVHAPTAGTGGAGAPSEVVLETAIEGDGPGVPNAGADLDGRLPFDLSSLLSNYQPHPQQGWHVRLTVVTTFAQGSDVKHKVFWIEACGTADPQPAQTPGSDPAPGPETAVPPAAVVTTTTTAPVQVQGVQQTRVLARTGSSDGALVLVAGGLVVAGLGLVRLGSARRSGT
jgi:hypothetical protein